MARRKRAWDMSNPLYRYLNSGKRSKRTRSRGVKMARRSRRSRGGGMGGMLGGKNMLPMGGAIGKGILGVGAASVASRFLPNILGQWQGAAIGFLVGGAPGALGGYLHDNTSLTKAATSGGASNVPVSQ